MSNDDNGSNNIDVSKWLPHALSSSRLGTSLIFLGTVGALLAAVLHVLVVDCESLVDLSTESGVIVNTSPC
jgi:hypothetical protein